MTILGLQLATILALLMAVGLAIQSVRMSRDAEAAPMRVVFRSMAVLVGLLGINFLASDLGVLVP